ncbi:HAD family hydrolase [Candidatus Kaiserbacteria bacterium]|nr:HAD family hydrolase [Candidatus Kaiserbacteria bacterium]
MKGRKYVLFDFDGVIADSYAVAWSTAKKLCARLTDGEYRSLFEGNVYETHDALLSEPHGPECSHDLDWFSIFTPAFEEQATLFAGMREVIENLSHTYVLVIVSSTLTSPIQGFLEKHHIGRYFSEVMGADVHTGKREKIHMIFEKYDITAPLCVFITDTLGDMHEAKAAGVGAIGVSWGFHPRETLQKGEPFRIVDRPKEIPAAVSDYFTRSN